MPDTFLCKCAGKAGGAQLHEICLCLNSTLKLQLQSACRGAGSEIGMRSWELEWDSLQEDMRRATCDVRAPGEEAFFVPRNTASASGVVQYQRRDSWG